MSGLKTSFCCMWQKALFIRWTNAKLKPRLCNVLSRLKVIIQSGFALEYHDLFHWKVFSVKVMYIPEDEKVSMSGVFWRSFIFLMFVCWFGGFICVWNKDLHVMCHSGNAPSVYSPTACINYSFYTNFQLKCGSL